MHIPKFDGFDSALSLLLIACPLCEFIGARGNITISEWHERFAIREALNAEDRNNHSTGYWITFRWTNFFVLSCVAKYLGDVYNYLRRPLCSCVSTLCSIENNDRIHKAVLTHLKACYLEGHDFLRSHQKCCGPGPSFFVPKDKASVRRVCTRYSRNSSIFFHPLATRLALAI